MLLKTVIALLSLGLTLATGFALSSQPVSQADGLFQEGLPLQGKKIYLGSVNGEVSLFDRNETGASRLAAMLLRQGAELLLLNWDAAIPADADLVMLIAPTQDYSGAQIAQLWNYVTQGGNLLVFAEPYRGIQPASSLMELLWDAFGIRMQPGVLVNSLYLDPAVIISPDTVVTNLVAPPEVQHPILAGLETGLLAMVSACPLQTESVILDIAVQPLLVTVEQYFGEANPQAIPNNRVAFNIGADVAPGPQTVAAAAFNNQTQARVAVMCDADLVINKTGFVTSPAGSDRFVFPESVKLVFNTIYWELEIDGNPRFDFQPPAPTATPTITPSPVPTSTPAPPQSGSS